MPRRYATVTSSQIGNVVAEPVIERAVSPFFFEPALEEVREDATRLVAALRRGLAPWRRSWPGDACRRHHLPRRWAPWIRAGPSRPARRS